MKFYTSAWRNDPRLRMCSVAARGLWMELICLMHEAEPYGHLRVSGSAPTDAQIGVLAGIPSDQVPDLLMELETHGVFSRTKDGVIYSRRMTRDMRRRAVERKNGQKGGNPKLTGNYHSEGFIYLMGVRSDGAYKIGASVNPRNRLKKIRAQYPGEDIRVLRQWWTLDMGTLEWTLHRTLTGKMDGEWFFLSAQDIERIEEIADPKGTTKDPPLTKILEARITSPDGLAGEVPADAPDNVLVFREGVSLFVGVGESEQRARSSLGKLRKVAGNDDARLLAAVRAAQRQGVVDPYPWLLRALEASNGGSGTSPLGRAFDRLQSKVDRSGF